MAEKETIDLSEELWWAAKAFCVCFGATIILSFVVITVYGKLKGPKLKVDKPQKNRVYDTGRGAPKKGKPTDIESPADRRNGGHKRRVWSTKI
mmetsp:Transcript_17585/g.33384  ORF Transcript_17585/g.33384 Transcript_17585/m.33384 type:complete len:93 (+) Transcript_17585:42-320(+)